jgi:glycosyltransferase involved in cell wall biosynthesis
MKILTVSGPLHREFGGPPMAATGAAASLATLGHQVRMLVCGQSVNDIQMNSVFFDKLSHSGAEVNVLRRRGESEYGAVIRFHELKTVWSDVNKSDFVILHQIFKLQYIAIFPILLVLKKRYVVMPHGTLTTYQRKQHKLRKFLFYPATYLLLKFSQGIFVATEVEKSQLPGYLKGKGFTVGLGINLPEVQIRNQKPSLNTFNLLFMGRIAKKKRLDIALEAFALVKSKTDVELRFTICGSGEEDEIEVMRNLVKRLGIESEVLFRGWVDKEDKLSVLLGSDCFILTSEDENFANAAAEALSFGIPCVLSSNVALATLVSAYSAGAVFTHLDSSEVADAILSVLRVDKELSIENALNAASTLTWDCIALKWQAQIRELLDF